VPLESTATLYQVGTPQNSPSNFTGTVYVATPQLLATYGINASQIAPGTDIWSTQYAVSKYHLQPSLNGWLIQAPAPLTAAQVNAARQLALGYGVTAETKSRAPGPGEFAADATALGIVIAFGVLAACVGLIRSETARDLRTLTAAGASPRTRRTITAATTAALGLLGAILGATGAVIAGLAWTHSNLPAMFGDVPLSDVLILLAGLPLVAAAGGWLLAGREPQDIARQPLD
jgi:putative ABC transport system permease protein